MNHDNNNTKVKQHRGRYRDDCCEVKAFLVLSCLGKFVRPLSVHSFVRPFLSVVADRRFKRVIHKTNNNSNNSGFDEL